MDPAASRKVRGLRSRPVPAPQQKLRPVPVPPTDAELFEALPRGINVAGLEFGIERPGFCAEDPGKLGEDFILTRSTTFQRLSEVGFRVFRIPCRWERLQPELGGPLNPDMIQALRLQANLAAKFGGRTIIDIHNYGRYFTRRNASDPVECRLGEEKNGWTALSSDAFAELWSRISYALCGLPEIEGYGLMNEPFGLPPGAWVDASRKAVDAIRAGGDDKKVFVSGDRWASSKHWKEVNPSEPWIESSGGDVVYEAHCYFDHDASGEYVLSYEQELERDEDLAKRPLERLEPFKSWLEEHQVSGFLGEFATPVQDSRWAAMLVPFLEALDRAKIPCAWWAAGDGWANYPLAIQPEQHGIESTPASEALLRGVEH